VHSVPTDGFRISACSSRTDFCSTGFSVPAWLSHISVFHPAPRAYVRSRRFISAVAVFFVSVFGRRQVTTLGERLCVAWLPPVLLDLLAARRCATCLDSASSGCLWSVLCCFEVASATSGAFVFFVLPLQIFLVWSFWFVKVVVGWSRSTLELPDQKTRDFLVLIVLKRMLSEHVCKVFGEIIVRT
jgi:hypothetical protein